MKPAKHSFFKPNSLFSIALIFSIVFWLIDSSIDVIVFSEEESIVESLFSPEPVELWMRLFVIFMFIVFSYYSKYLLILQKHTFNELQELKDNLIDLVDERTAELNDRNELLQNEIKIRKETEEKLKIIAITDPLTELYNRRKFNEILSYEIVRDRRYRSGLSVILCDIDHFKKINDTYGHDTGDRVLKQFAQTISQSIRDSDLLARWGGEEFILLIINAEPEMAKLVAEKIRKITEETEFEVVKNLTISLGIASLTADDNEESLINRADNALYEAKNNGRNCLVVSE